MTHPRFENQPVVVRRPARVWLAVCAVVGVVAQTQAGEATDPFVDIAAKVRPGIVAVGTYDRLDAPSIRFFGSGFVVGDGHMAVTNKHVIDAVSVKEKLEDLRVFFADEAPTQGRRATVIEADAHHDVALLAFDGLPGTPLELNTQDVPRPGQGVGVMGYPIGTALGLAPAVHRGVVSALVPAVLPMPRGIELTPELAEAIRKPYNLLQLDMTVYPGNSGSPLFDALDGRVIGIVNKALATRTREHMLDKPSGIAYAVPVRWVYEIVQRHAPQNNSPQIDTPQNTPPNSSPTERREDSDDSAHNTQPSRE